MRPGTALLAATALASALSVAGAGPAAAHEVHGASAARTSVGAVAGQAALVLPAVVGVLAVLALALAAWASSRAWPRTLERAAAALAVGGLLLSADRFEPPVLVAVVAVLAAVAPLDRRLRLASALVAAAALGVAGQGIVLAVHLVGVGAWTGAALAAVRRPPSLERAGRLAVGGAVATVGAGLALSPSHLAAFTASFDGAWGRVLLLKVALAALAALLGLALVRRGRRGSGVEGGLLTAALVAGGVLAVLPSPAATDPAGSPQLHTFALGARTASVSVPGAPGPGLVVVDLSTLARGTSSADLPTLSLDGQPLVLRADGPDRWVAPVDLRSGRSRLRIALVDRTGSTAVSVGRVRPGPVRFDERIDLAVPGCLDRSLGHQLALAELSGGARRWALTRGATSAPTFSCGVAGAPPLVDAAGGPAALTVGSASGAVGSALGTFVQKRGDVVVVSDGSARSTSLVDGLRRTSAAVRVVGTDWAPEPTASIVVATEREAAASVLGSLATTGVGGDRGVVLAPWLLDTRLFVAAADPSTPQLLVPAALDPTGAAGRAYVSAIARLSPAMPPTADGLAGYVEARLALVAAASGVELDPRFTTDLGAVARYVLGLERPATDAPAAASIPLVSPARISIMPGDDHGHGTASWVTGGGLAVVSKVAAAS